MAAAAQQRIEAAQQQIEATKQYIERSKANHQHFHRINLDHIEVARQGNKFSYQNSRWNCSVGLAVQIPFNIAHLVSSLALTIFFLPFFLICGKNLMIRAQFNYDLTNLKMLPQKISKLVYATLIPSRGIDAYYDFMTKVLISTGRRV